MQRIIECRITAEHSNVPKARKSAEKSKLNSLEIGIFEFIAYW